MKGFAGFSLMLGFHCACSLEPGGDEQACGGILLSVPESGSDAFTISELISRRDHV